MKIIAPLAEFIGTFFLCFAGIAAILGAAGVGRVGHRPRGHCARARSGALGRGRGVWRRFGRALQSGRDVRLSYYRPDRPLRFRRYIVVQLAGATAAAAAAARCFPLELLRSAPRHSVAGGGGSSTGGVLIVEFAMTFLLMTAILARRWTSAAAVKIGGFGIGLTVTFDILAGGR